MTGRDAYGTPPPALRREETGMSRRALLRLGLTSRARADIDFDAVVDQVREDWAGEERAPLLRALAPVADVIAEVAGVSRGDRVLDIGAGDGNVALACVRRGAVADACDVAEAQVARGRARCGAAVTWTTADAQALPLPDGAYDAVLSAFGVPLAPRARTAAREMARVCRPGGRVVLAAWIPRGLPGRLFEAVEAVRPLPDGVRSPADWGVQAVARARLEPLLEDVTVMTRTAPLRFPSPEAMFDALAPRTLPDEARRRVRQRFDRLLAASNNRPPAAEVDARYLLVTGVRPLRPSAG